MLDRGRDNVLPLRIDSKGGVDRGVVRFRSAARENDFRWFDSRADAATRSRARSIGIAHLRTKRIAAGWVARKISTGTAASPPRRPDRAAS